MGTKIFYVGLALLLAAPQVFPVAGIEKAGAIVTIIGAVLICFDR